MIYSEHYKHAKSNHIILFGDYMENFVDIEEPKKYNNPEIYLFWFMKEDKFSNYAWSILSRYNFPHHEFCSLTNKVRR